MDIFLKELDEALKAAVLRFKEDLRGLRSSRPSIELIENLSVNYFDSWMTIKQLGSLSLLPPREVRITVWDKNAAAPIAKAIEEAQAGFSVSMDGATIRATLSALSNERREELGKLVKKTAEGARISVRNVREDIIKKLRAAEDGSEITEDQSHSGKEKIQKRVNDANAEIEVLVEEKLKELAE
jgi:ribosome recycling factor